MEANLVYISGDDIQCLNTEEKKERRWWGKEKKPRKNRSSCASTVANLSIQDWVFTVMFMLMNIKFNNVKLIKLNGEGEEEEEGDDPSLEFSWTDDMYVYQHSFNILLTCLVLCVYSTRLSQNSYSTHQLLSPFTSQQFRPSQRISHMKDGMLVSPAQLSNTVLPGWFRRFIQPLIKQQRIYWQQMGEQCFSEEWNQNYNSVHTKKRNMGFLTGNIMYSLHKIFSLKHNFIAYTTFKPVSFLLVDSSFD